MGPTEATWSSATGCRRYREARMWCIKKGVDGSLKTQHLMTQRRRVRLFLKTATALNKRCFAASWKSLSKLYGRVTTWMRSWVTLVCVIGRTPTIYLHTFFQLKEGAIRKMIWRRRLRLCVEPLCTKPGCNRVAESGDKCDEHLESKRQKCK